MAKIIKFCVPGSFRRKGRKWTPREECGKLVMFVAPHKTSARTLGEYFWPVGSKHTKISG